MEQRKMPKREPVKRPAGREPVHKLSSLEFAVRLADAIKGGVAFTLNTREGIQMARDDINRLPPGQRAKFHAELNRLIKASK